MGLSPSLLVAALSAAASNAFFSQLQERLFIGSPYQGAVMETLVATLT